METEKPCTKCGETKPMHEFYRHPYAKDGRQGKCKECTKADVRANRQAKLDYYQWYERQRANLPHRVEARKQYQQTEAGKQSLRRTRQRYVARNPIKRGAHHITGNAIRDGKLQKQPCEVCGAEQVHAHHDDYAKPLEVRWLCPQHHQEWHDKHGEGKNAD